MIIATATKTGTIIVKANALRRGDLIQDWGSGVRQIPVHAVWHNVDERGNHPVVELADGSEFPLTGWGAPVEIIRP